MTKTRVGSELVAGPGASFRILGMPLGRHALSVECLKPWTVAAMSVGQASGLSLRGQLLTHVGTGCDGRNAGYPDGTRPFHFHLLLRMAIAPQFTHKWV